MEKLPEDFKAKWIAALRSGKFKQCRTQLFKDSSHGKESGYCCIGVFGKINNIPISTNGSEFLQDGSPAGYQPVINLIGSDNVNKLWKMNDGSEDITRHSFSEIADYIEQNL